MQTYTDVNIFKINESLKHERGRRDPAIIKSKSQLFFICKTNT